jgi:hypothetical protein
MRVLKVTPEQKFLFDLLTTVKEEGLILQTADGQQFILLSLEDWQGFLEIAMILIRKSASLRKIRN